MIASASVPLRIHIDAVRTESSPQGLDLDPTSQVGSAPSAQSGAGSRLRFSVFRPGLQPREQERKPEARSPVNIGLQKIEEGESPLRPPDANGKRAEHEPAEKPPVETEVDPVRASRVQREQKDAPNDEQQARGGGHARYGCRSGGGANLKGARWRPTHDILLGTGRVNLREKGRHEVCRGPVPSGPPHGYVASYEQTDQKETEEDDPCGAAHGSLISERRSSLHLCGYRGTLGGDIAI